MSRGISLKLVVVNNTHTALGNSSSVGIEVYDSRLGLLFIA
ncbi:hypothetical protein [Moritella dasanensis]|nr:hypothetical protein [Moritella dasanensis]